MTEPEPTLGVSVWLAGALRPHAGGLSRVAVRVRPGGTAAEVLDQLFAGHPALAPLITDERGAVRRHVNVFVGTTNIRDTGGLATPVPADTDISVLPATSGG